MEIIDWGGRANVPHYIHFEAHIIKLFDMAFCLLLQEKAPYVAKAAARKVEYEKTVKAYNAKQVI